MVVSFEDSFAGLLSAIAYCFRKQVKPQGLCVRGRQPTLLQEVEVPTENGILQLFRRHLAQQCGQSAATAILDTTRHAWYAQMDSLPLQIHDYLQRALQLQDDPSPRLYEKPVRDVVTAARKVGAQVHVYQGLLRFKKTPEGLYLADFRPDYHVLPLLLPHFKSRFADQAFVIRDLRRQWVALHLADGRCQIFRLLDTGEASQSLARLGNEKDPFLPMWQTYLQKLSIPERENRALQRQHMPRKYWRYLSEDPGDF